MPLSWNEIRHRAIQFALNWTGTRSEAAEKQTFWNEFFDLFGLQRRLVIRRLRSSFLRGASSRRAWCGTQERVRAVLRQRVAGWRLGLEGVIVFAGRHD